MTRRCRLFYGAVTVFRAIFVFVAPGTVSGLVGLSGGLSACRSTERKSAQSTRKDTPKRRAEKNKFHTGPSNAGSQRAGAAQKSGSGPLPSKKVEAARFAPPPTPLPEIAAGRTASALPRPVTVDPPPHLTATLGQIISGLAATDRKTVQRANRSLHRMIHLHGHNPRFVRFLLSARNPALVQKGLRRWRKMSTHPHFLAVLVSLFGHPRDRIRMTALTALSWTKKKKMVSRSAPFVRLLLKDPSCVVRRTALHYLIDHAEAQAEAVGDLRAAVEAGISDPCPAVKMTALDGVGRVLGEAAVGASLRKQLLGWVQSSPHYGVRCAAMLALGRLREKDAVRAIGTNLTLGATTGLVVYFADGKTPYTANMKHGNVPACAAAALSLLHGEKPASQPVEGVRRWRAALHKKGWVSAPSKRLCLGKHDCRQLLARRHRSRRVSHPLRTTRICLNMRCVAIEKAVGAFWRMQARTHCAAQKEKARKEKAQQEKAQQEKAKRSYRNFADPTQVAVGLGLHWAACQTIRRFLRHRDEAAYRRKMAALRAAPCR